MASLKDLELGPAATKRFAFTRKQADGSEREIEVLFRVLTTRELEVARVAARKKTLDLGKDANLTDGRDYFEILEDQRIVEVLAVALRDPENVERPFVSPLELETKLTVTELGLLWKAYEEFQQDAGPVMHGWTLEQFNAWIEAAAEGKTDFLVSHASHTRKAFITSMAEELLSWRTGKLRHTSSDEGSSPAGDAIESGPTTTEAATPTSDD